MTTALLADRRGAVLVEFALVALVTTLLFAATTDLGRLVFTAQVVQDAARAGARELAVTPLPAEMTFDEALLDPTVRSRVFDPDQLAIDVTASMNNGTFDLNATCTALPIINRVLCPLMIVDGTSVPGVTLLRYPGALLTTATGFSVAIPRVTARDATGVETIEWVSVIEEARSDPADPSTGPFTLTSGTTSSGTVALRINYPFQAAAMSGFRTSDPAHPLEPNGMNVNVADDAAVMSLQEPPGGTLVSDQPGAGTYAGPYGLGRQYAFAGKTVRPFRRLISAQAVFRREVFQEQQGATP
jgi:Flp pilus assembly protein TadG